MSIYSYEDLNKCFLKQRSIKNNKTHVKKAKKICTNYNTFDLRESSQNPFLSFKIDQPIAMLLKKLPNSYLIENLFINRVNLASPSVTAFVHVDEKPGLAYFINGDSSLVVDRSRIDGIDCA
ncbi:hypothetical protein ASE46_28600 [Bacillus sp. Root239]|nr:hypothetical protein ASE46_28600 [Bacillus sp. Root239]